MKANEFAKGYMCVHEKLNQFATRIKTAMDHLTGLNVMAILSKAMETAKTTTTDKTAKTTTTDKTATAKTKPTKCELPSKSESEQKQSEEKKKSSRSETCKT